MTLHHLIFDAVTAYRVLVPELGALYEAFSAGQASPLPEPQLQYADFACWQRRNLSLAISSEHEAYWRKQMARELPLCQWPNDRPRPTVQTHRGAIERFAFPATLVQRLRVLSQQAGVSLYMTLLAGFVAMLRRYTEQDNIVIGSLTAGRNRVELEQMMGHFVNPLALRFDMSGNPTFRELQLRVRNVVLEGLAHESVPFSQVVKLAQQRNDPGRHPLFQIILSQQPRLQHVAPGWELITEEVSNGGSKLDLTVVIDDRGDAVSGPITYNPDLFDVSTIRRAVEHWRTLLEGAADDASRGILDLPILTERERNQIQFDWNQTALEFPRSKTLHELLEDQVKKTPDAVAITFEDQSLTYHELNQRADRVARYLQSLGVGPDVPVGLFVERSFEMMAGILGVLKAGGTCLPLDPAYPAERLSFMLGETQAPVVLTHSRLRAQLPTHNAEVVCLDTEREFSGKDVLPAVAQAASATNIAYIIYTSGSTGHPKGVRVTHSGLVNSTLARTAYYRETLRSFLLLSSFTFDSSLAGIFWTLSVGGTLVLPPDSSQWELDSLSFLIGKNQISHLLCVPSLYQTLIENSPSERLASLKVAIVAGESCPVALVEEHYRRLPRAALYNEYGPTEATVWCSAYRCEPQAEAIRVPIGRPIANTQLYVLDSHREMVPVGVPGELYVGGAGVAGGYWNRPELTAEKFISDPFSSTSGARLYKTGDLARFLPDGNIEYLGRVDHQVKIRGFRIELGEIEAGLASHPGVREAVVVAREDVAGEKRLVAYYTASNTNGKSTGVAELRSHLSGKLPEYMVPAAYVRIESMPVTANGKLDRKALPMPEGDAYAVLGYEAPQGEMETRLAEIWGDVLKIDRVGRNDNFFELGGHSLLAMQVMARIRHIFNLELPVRSIFDEPTVAGSAVELQKAQVLGFKARAHIGQLRSGSTVARPNREALLAQLDNLSAAELKSLLQHVRDDKHSP